MRREYMFLPVPSGARDGIMSGNRGFCGFRRGAACFLLSASLLSGAFPGVLSALPAYASSPEFARTSEEWAALRDNRMEYWEIEGLIQEYNPTVQQNQYDYRKFVKDYGDRREDISDEYRRLANELRDDIVYPDSDDPGYAMGMMAALTAEMQANQLDQQADNNLEDAESIRLSYEMAEKALVQTARSNFISWHSAVTAIDQAEVAKQLAELDWQKESAQAAAGAGTQIKVLTADQAVKEADKDLIEARTKAETIRQKLQIMLGWKADSVPEIGDAPQLDLSVIDAMNPEADLPKALEANYTLRINKIKLQNALNETDYNTLVSTIADNEARIAASLATSYRNVQNQKNLYLAEQANLVLVQQTAAQSEQGFAVGTVSRIDRDTALLGLKQAELSLRQSEFSLLQSIDAYEWAVKGLASASASGG